MENLLFSGRHGLALSGVLAFGAVNALDRTRDSAWAVSLRATLLF